MKYLPIIFFIVFAFINLSNSEDYIQMYVTADVLNSRITPDLKGKIFIQIPFGTIVHVKKTENSTIYNGKSSHWVYIKETNSYALENFFSIDTPTDNKFMNLLINFGNEGCPSQCEQIILSKMKAIFKSHSFCHDSFIDEYKEGTYAVKDNRIEIHWSSCESTQEYISYSNDTPFGKRYGKKVEKCTAGIENFYWDNIAIGWIDQYLYKEIKSKQCVWMSNYYDCSESCKVLNNKKGCKKYTAEEEYMIQNSFSPIYHYQNNKNCTKSYE